MNKVTFSLYLTLKNSVGVFFNLLNILLGGKLPPMGCVSVVVEEHQRYLIVERASGECVFPGGFMQWHEQPVQAILRESKEETGLDLRIGEVIGYQVVPGRQFYAISTINIIYHGDVIGGALSGSMEGQPCWLPGEIVRKRLGSINQEIFDEYQKYRARKEVSGNGI